MQGVRVENMACKTKAMLKRAVASNLGAVTLEATSVFGNEFDGHLIDAPNGTYYVVGPDPYYKRSWYAQITKTGKKVTVK